MGRPSVKEQLIERTLSVWLDRGFEGASVNDLVTAAGVPKGSFYNHFSSKEDFAVEHVHRYVRGIDLESLTDAEGPVREVVRRHFERQIAARREFMQPACLLGTFSTGVSADYPELKAAVQDGLDQWIEALTTVLTQARESGEIASDTDPADLAAALVDGFQGAVARVRVTGRSKPLKTFLGSTVDLLIRAP